jgi:signal transduction histidine kinase
VALPLLLLLTGIFVSEIRRERTEARNAALGVARAAAAQMQTMHTDANALLERMAARPNVRNFDGTSCDSLFAVVDFDPQDESLFFYDMAGRLLCRSSPHDDSAVSLAAQEWIARQVRDGTLKAQTPTMCILAHRLASVLALPVSDARGNRRGVIALLQLPKILGSDQLPPKSVLTVLDRNGVIIARSDQQERFSGRNIRDSVLARAALQQKEGRTEAVGVDGVSRQYGFTYLPDVGWYVYAGIPTDLVMGPVNRLVAEGLMGGAAIVLLVVTVALILARRIQKPIDALAGAASSIADGTYPTVAVEGPREIALLAQTFNEMAESRSRSEARILESERNLKALSERLLNVQENERMRVARELHDDLGQSLTALKMDLIGLLDKIPTAAGTAPISDRILRTLDSTVTAVQRISSELRPSMLDDFGLIAALESEARLFEERSGIECETSFPEELPDLDAGVSTAIYRMVQEALTNAARHSNATRVELRVRERADELFLEIRDDGRGIAPEQAADPASLGLAGIRERADMLGGTAIIEGIDGHGTIVSIRLPRGARTGREA